MILAPFSFCCCYEFWLPFPPAAADAAAADPRMGKHKEKITSRQGNTMPLKDGEAPKLHLENA